MHLHWRFMAWNGEANVKEIMFPVQAAVIGYNDEQSALEAIKKIIIREQYSLNSVYECNTCTFNQRNADNIQRLADKA